MWAVDVASIPPFSFITCLIIRQCIMRLSACRRTLCVFACWYCRCITTQHIMLTEKSAINASKSLLLLAHISRFWINHISLPPDEAACLTLHLFPLLCGCGWFGSKSGFVIFLPRLTLLAMASFVEILTNFRKRQHAYTFTHHAFSLSNCSRIARILSRPSWVSLECSRTQYVPPSGVSIQRKCAPSIEVPICRLGLNAIAAKL